MLRSRRLMSFEASSTRSRAPEFQNVVPSGLRRAAGQLPAAFVDRAVDGSHLSQTKTPPFCGGVQSGGVSLLAHCKTLVSGGDTLFRLVRLAQHVAAGPHGFDEGAA